MKEYISKKYEIVARLQLRGKHFEFWLPIKDFPNYEVSTEGRVRNVKTGYIKKLSIGGRKHDSLYTELVCNGVARTQNVARLVLTSFVKTPFCSGKIVHLDKNPLNNSLSNLEYADDTRCATTLDFFPIKGFPLYLINKRGDIMNRKSKRIQRQSIDKDGYVKATLSKNGKSNYFRVSRLVAQTFIQNPNNLPFVNHKNGIKTDNRVENLEWCTARENSIHAVSTGLVRTGNEKNNSKLKEEYIPWIKKMRSAGISCYQIAKVYDVSSKTIYCVLKNKTWI